MAILLSFKEKAPPLGEAFFTLYIQNSRFRELDCQISLSLMVCKWRVMLGNYLGAEARPLTKTADFSVLGWWVNLI
jgi:hypothetical protein